MKPTWGAKWDPQPAAKGQQQVQVQEQALAGKVVSINGLLRLHPPALEAASWRSPAAVRLLHTVDLLALTNSILVNAGVVAALGPSLTPVQLGQFVLYGVLAVLQLGLLLARPQLHQQHRFKVMLAHRLMRLASVTVSGLSITRTDVKRFAAAINGSSSSSSSPGGIDPLGNSSSGSRSGLSDWMTLLRPLLSLPLFFLNHTNYVVPFSYVLPAQLWSAVMNVFLARITACNIVNRPHTSALLARRVCQALKLSMHYLVLLGQPPRQAAKAAAAECGGVEGVFLLVLFTNVCVLVVLPCLVVYFVELDLKAGFASQQRLVLQHAWPCQQSRLGKGVAVYGVVVGAWMACEVVVTLLSPMQCDAGSGMLTVTPPWQALSLQGA